MTGSNKRNAAQRIEDLEQALMSLYQTANNMASDLTTVKEAIKLLGNKLDSVVKATGITDDQVSALMIENNVAELKSKVDGLVTQGILIATEETAANSFVVGKEVDDDGAVVNPRLQFSLTALQPELRDKLVGSKVGDVVTLQEGKLKLEVLEIYSVQGAEVAPEPSAETEVVQTDNEAAGQ